MSLWIFINVDVYVGMVDLEIIYMYVSVVVYFMSEFECFK